ncbi:L1 [Ailuropoda melanoleuca papillomavirus 4]|uniref:Major capsid protein L1 n=1 Tax=Ailuropoda melanoleuca papillomavirus 4 TaxID=2016453 RepID=A0A220IGG3_9PAPI|nr:L1 [Ailuropoda melanoleuca papillomavirus 4]
MALWIPNSQKLFLPPAPVAKIASTDDYVQRTTLYYHANSDRLLTVGHPYYEIKTPEGGIKVPKVSGNQYRVFRVLLPDPNAFAFSDGSVYNADRERLVWACRGVDIGRGQPLGIGLSGHPLFNRYADTENPPKYNGGEVRDDNRQSVSFDVKQTQLLIVGCTPPVGEHWKKAPACTGVAVTKGDCPALELVNSTIQDGDMADIGYGAMDFHVLNENRSEVPLDIADSICKYPDFLKMSKDTTGDSMFFFARREQMYTRHFFSRGGLNGEAIPENLYKKAKQGQAQQTPSTSVYFATPSGSLVSSDAQLFNRPYWLHRAQGLNNGICWLNELFVTVLDNTRGTNMSISVATTAAEEYTANEFKEYMRHVEEFELTFIFQLCKVALTPENLALLHTMNPTVLENWNLGLQPPTSSALEDTYRFLSSAATPCPGKVAAPPAADPYEALTFWTVDLRERMSNDLDQFPLGRKFIAQNAAPPTRKRAAPTRPKSTSAKRRRR